MGTRSRAMFTADWHGLVTWVQRYGASGIKRLRKIWVDAGSQAQWWCDGVRRLKRTHQVELEVVEHTGQGFQVVQHCGKVERTCAGLRYAMTVGVVAMTKR